MATDPVSVLNGGGAVPCNEYPLASGETLALGDFVELLDDGTIKEASATSAALLGRYRPQFLTGENPMVEEAQANVLFMVRVENHASLPPIGSTRDVAVLASGEHVVASSNSTYDVFRVHSYPDWVVDVSGVVYALVTVPTAKSQATGGDAAPTAS